MKTTGFAIIIIGIILTAFTGLNSTTHKNVVEMNLFEINKIKNTSLTLSPVLGSLLIVTGITLFVIGDKKSLT
jgi:uncharacterized membrane protein